MANELFLFGDDLAQLTYLAAGLRGVAERITLIDRERALQRMTAQTLPVGSWAIVCLTGHENVFELRSAVASMSASHVLFVARDATPHSSVAHAVHAVGGEIVGRDESTVVVAAIMVASRLHAGERSSEPA